MLLQEFSQTLPQAVLLLQPVVSLFGTGLLKTLLRVRVGGDGIDDPVKVIMLTMYDDEAFFREALDAGVWGYLLKECAVDELVNPLACGDPRPSAAGSCPAV